MPVTINGSTGVTFPNSTLQATAAFGGGTTTSSAVDITLTATSTQVQYISMTAANKFVILPDATTLSKGAGLFTITNTGQYPFHIKDSGGNIIYYNVLANETLTLSLLDNSAAIGKWSTGQATLDLSVGLPQVSSIAPYYAAYAEPAVAMLSTTQALIFYKPSTNTISVVLATISGTSVSYGTPVAVVDSLGSSQPFMAAMRFNSTTGIIGYTSGTNWILRAVTVSGSTVTVGAVTNVTSNNAAVSGYGMSIEMINSTTGFVGYATTSPAILVRAFTVSGTTITLGSAVTTGSESSEFYSVSQIASGKVLFTYYSSGYKARVATNSGTTLTLGTAITLPTDPVVAVGSGYVKIATDAACGATYTAVYGYAGSSVTVSGTTINTPITTSLTPGMTYPQIRLKYLSDGLQLCYSTFSGSTAYLSINKGNSTVGTNSALALKTTIFMNIGYNPKSPLDVINGNMGILVGVTGGFLTSQVIGVL